MSPLLLPLVAPYIRSLVTSLSSQRPRFNVWEVHLGSVVDKLQRRSFSPSVSIFPGQLSSHQCSILHYHHLTLLTGPQHTTMAMERCIHHTVRTVVPSRTDRPTVNTAVLATSLHSLTTNTPVCHKHYVQIFIYALMHHMTIYPRMCCWLFSLKHMQPCGKSTIYNDSIASHLDVQSIMRM